MHGKQVTALAALLMVSTLSVAVACQRSASDVPGSGTTHGSGSSAETAAGSGETIAVSPEGRARRFYADTFALLQSAPIHRADEHVVASESQGLLDSLVVERTEIEGDAALVLLRMSARGIVLRRSLWMRRLDDNWWLADRPDSPHRWAADPDHTISEERLRSLQSAEQLWRMQSGFEWWATAVP